MHACTPLNFPDIALAPSNPSPTKFLKSRPEDVQYDSIELAIPSPIKSVTVTKPRNFSFKIMGLLFEILVVTSALRLLALRGWRTLCVRKRIPSVAWGHIG